MSQLNINDFPSEMLTKIFRMLDAVDLKNATLACKLWNNLIESGCRWSVSVYDNENCVTPPSLQKMNFILTTKRRFGKILIYQGRLSEDNQMFEIFRRQGFNVVKLCLRWCVIDNRAVFAQLLKLTPNLESLDITMLKLHNETDVLLDPVLPELKKLKILHMSQSQSPIIGCFRNAKLTTIRISRCLQDEKQGTEPLVDFLSSQPTLTSLTIDGYNLPRSILAEMGKLDVPIPFRLTKLGILSLGNLNSSQDHDNLVRFIESQAESLTEVDLRHNLPISVYESVFGSLTKLRTLNVALDQLPRNPDFYDRLKENRSVCTMALWRFESFDVEWLGEIFKRLPNIRRLILPGRDTGKESALAVMAQHLGRLESLSIFEIRFSIGYVQFADLRTLHIGHLFAKINWNEFTKANPRLVELIIEHILTRGNRPLLTSDDIDQITTNVDLQYLRLGGGFVADDRFFEIIRAKCPNLKVLELHRSCVPHGLMHNVEVNVLQLCEQINCPTWVF